MSEEKLLQQMASEIEALEKKLSVAAEALKICCYCNDAGYRSVDLCEACTTLAKIRETK